MKNGWWIDFLKLFLDFIVKKFQDFEIDRDNVTVEQLSWLGRKNVAF